MVPHGIMKGRFLMVLSIVIWCMALFFVITGICDFCSKKPTGIHTNLKTPELEKIRDLRAYNRAVGLLGIGGGFGYIIIGIASIFASEKTSGMLILISAYLGSIIMISVYETVIDRKYITR